MRGGGAGRQSYVVWLSGRHTSAPVCQATNDCHHHQLLLKNSSTTKGKGKAKKKNKEEKHNS